MSQDPSQPSWPERPPGTSPAEPRATVGALWAMLAPQRPVLVLGAVLSALGAATSLLQPIAMVGVINAVAAGTPVGRPLLLLAVLFLLDGLLLGVQTFVLLRAGEAFACSVRQRLLSRIMFWQVRTFDRYRRGDLLSRVSNDAAALRAVIGEGVVELVGAVLALVGAVVLMIIIDPVLFVTSVAVLAVAGAGAALFLSRISRATEASQQAVGMMSADLDRALSGIRTVVTSGMRAAERRRVEDRAREALETGSRAAWWEALVSPVLLTGANAAFLVVFGVGGARVASGALDLAEFISFVLYFAVLVPPILMATQAVTTVSRALGSVHRIQAVLDEPSVPEPSPGVDDVDAAPASLPAAPVRVRVSGLCFAYDQTRAVLDRLDLDLSPGSVTAVTGPSGSGKTTLLSVLVGLEEPDAGVVHLDGVPLGEIPLPRLRRWVAYVQQDAPVFWGSVRDNVTYGLTQVTGRHASEEEVWQVLEALDLRRLVEGLPGRLEAAVGERGDLLSGGERQRLAIARALLRQPRLMVLDEPTANLDGAAETRLLAALAACAPSCTIVLTTHRRSTADAADQVVDLLDLQRRADQAPVPPEPCETSASAASATVGGPRHS